MTEKKPTNILQGKPINVLMKCGPKSFAEDVLTGKGVAVKDKVTVTIQDVETHKLNANALKLLLFTLSKLSEKIHYGDALTPAQTEEKSKIEFSLSEYMELCGFKNKQRARDTLWKSADTLMNTTLRWTCERPLGDDTQRLTYECHVYEDMVKEEHISKRDVIKNGKVTVHVGHALTECLSRAYVMPINLNLMLINSNDHPHSLYLGYRLMLHYNMNCGKANEARIGVKTLVEACPQLKSGDEVDQRREKQEIMNPFNRDMDVLCSSAIQALVNWSYITPGGKKLSAEEANTSHYSDWESYCIEFNVAGQENIAQIKASKEKRKQEAKAARKRKPRKKGNAVPEPAPSISQEAPDLFRQYMDQLDDTASKWTSAQSNADISA